jgi:hypothetical protein
LQNLAVSTFSNRQIGQVSVPDITPQHCSLLRHPLGGWTNTIARAPFPRNTSSRSPGRPAGTEKIHRRLRAPRLARVDSKKPCHLVTRQCRLPSALFARVRLGAVFCPKGRSHEITGKRHASVCLKQRGAVSPKRSAHCCSRAASLIDCRSPARHGATRWATCRRSFETRG